MSCSYANDNNSLAPPPPGSSSCATADLTSLIRANNLFRMQDLWPRRSLRLGGVAASGQRRTACEPRMQTGHFANGQGCMMDPPPRMAACRAPRRILCSLLSDIFSILSPPVCRLFLYTAGACLLVYVYRVIYLSAFIICVSARLLQLHYDNHY